MNNPGSSCELGLFITLPDSISVCFSLILTFVCAVVNKKEFQKLVESAAVMKNRAYKEVKRQTQQVFGDRKGE